MQTFAEQYGESSSGLKKKKDIYQTEEKTLCVFHQAYTLLIKA